jgi:hypothetical protein
MVDGSDGGPNYFAASRAKPGDGLTIAAVKATSQVKVGNEWLM